MQFALIPAGEFWMGSSEEHIKWAIEYANSHYIRPNQIAERIAREGPPRRVFVRIPFYLGVFEVTQSEFQQIMGPNSIARPAQQQPPAGDYARLPVGNVSWNEAVEFCRRLSRSPRERAARCQYRLPTEAEWEYACFAGATVSEPNRLKGIYNVTGTTWYASNSGKNPHCVGEKQPNKWGLYDMLGNVAEWCFNQYDVNYFAQSPPTSKKSPNAPRAVRGGSFADGSLSSRPSYRSQAAPDSRKPEIGFRVVLVR
jgi:formylglycine-generating enzyme required for sulfatase activity